MGDLDGSEAPGRRDSVAWVELEGEAVLYEEDSGSLHLLDPIACIVWQCYDGQTDLATLIDELSAAFEAPRERIEQDVLELTRELAVQGLVSGVDVEPETEEAPA